MQITVIVAFDAAQALHKRDLHSAESKGLLKIAESLGVTLNPMHSGTKDPNLIRYFTVEAVDNQSAMKVIECLKRSAAVEGAYLKPGDELP